MKDLKQMAFEKKQKKFEEFYIKFISKCLTENIFPVMTMRYEFNGIFPVLDFREVDEKKKKELLSSLDKQE